MTRTLHRLTAPGSPAGSSPATTATAATSISGSPGGTKGWIFRFKMYGRTRDAGLGSYPAVSLARRAQRAFEYRALVADGVDPIEQRNAQQAAARVENAKTITFDDCAKAYIAAHADGWRNAKHRQQWVNTLDAYASPVFGKLPVRAIAPGSSCACSNRCGRRSLKRRTAARPDRIGAQLGHAFVAIASAKILHVAVAISIVAAGEIQGPQGRTPCRAALCRHR